MSFEEKEERKSILEVLLPGRKASFNYDPNQAPPDFDLAIKHGKAKRIYRNKTSDDSPNTEKCPCCGLPIEGEEIPLTASLSEIYHLGCGYALYLKFIKCSIALLTLIFVTTGMYNLISNAKGTTCQSGLNYIGLPDGECVQDSILTYTIANKMDDKDALWAQLVLNLLIVVVIIVFLHYIRYELRKIKIDADDKTTTPSDFTVKLSGVSENTFTNEIRDWIESFQTPNHSVNVRKITRSYNFIKYTELIKQKEALEGKHEENNDRQTEDLGAKLEELHVSLQKLKKDGLTYANLAFVTLETAKQARFIRRKFRKTLAQKGLDYVLQFFKATEDTLKGNTIKIKRAPEPSDVVWENLGFPKNLKRKRRNHTIFITALLIILSLAIIVCLSFIQGEAIANLGQGSLLVQILAFIASIILMMVNYVLGQYIRKLTEYEKHNTYTNYFTGVANKLSIAQLINTAFTTLAAKVLLAILFATSVNISGEGGLLESMFYVFISNAFTTPIMNIFDPWYFLKLYERRKALKTLSNQKMAQSQAQILFEGPKMDMSYKYAVVTKTCLLTAFYAPAIPVTLLFAIAGLFLVYWSDKYILLRRAALPLSLGDSLTKSMLKYLEAIAFMYALGNLAVVYTLQNSSGGFAFDPSSYWLPWLTLGLSIIHIFLPMDLINKRLFHLKDIVDVSDVYDKERLKFYIDYDIANPVTHKQGLRDLQQAIYENTRNDGLAKALGLNDEAIALMLEKSNIQEKRDIESQEVEENFDVLEAYIKQIKENPFQAIEEKRNRDLGNFKRNDGFQSVILRKPEIKDQDLRKTATML